MIEPKDEHRQAHLSDRDRPQDRARRQGSRREEAAPRGAPPLPRRVGLRRGPGAPGAEPHQDLLPAAGALRRARSTPTRSGPTASSCSPSPSSPARSTRSGRSSSRATQEVPDAELRAIMKTSAARPSAPGQRPAGAVGPRRRPRQPAALLRPRRLYAGRGRPAQVETTGQDLRLVIPIQEGPRERVVKMDFQGTTALDLEGAAQDPAAPGGEAGSTPSSSTARWTILRARYAAKGYNRAQLSARQDWNPDHTLVDLTIEALEGPRQVVGPHPRARQPSAPGGRDPAHASTSSRGEPVSQATLLRGRAQPLPARHLLPGRRGVRPRQPRRDRARRAGPGRGGESRAASSTASAGTPRAASAARSAFTDNNVCGKAYSLRTDLRWSQRDKRFHILFNQPYLGRAPGLADHHPLLRAGVAERPPLRGDPLRRPRRGRARCRQPPLQRRLRLPHRRAERRSRHRLQRASSGSTSPTRSPASCRASSGTAATIRSRPPAAGARWRRSSTPSRCRPSAPTPSSSSSSSQQTGYLQPRPPGSARRRASASAASTPYKAIPSSGGIMLDFPSRNIPIAERLFAGGDATNRAYWQRRAGHPRGDADPQPQRRRLRAGRRRRPAPLQPRIPLPGLRRFRRLALLRQRQRLGRLALDPGGRAQERHRPRGPATTRRSAPSAPASASSSTASTASRRTRCS